MIFCFGAKLGYEGSFNAFILSDNLASTFEDPAIIAKKLKDDLIFGQIKEMQLTPLFICLPLGLISKYNGS